MVKTTSTRRVMVGEPEHVIDGRTAVKLLANRLKLSPESLGPRAVTHGVLTDPKTGQFAGPEAVRERFGVGIGPAKKLGAAADALAGNVISRLTGNEHFKTFTLESIAAMTPDFLAAVSKPDENRDLEAVMAEQPASNGKIYTTHQLLRTEQALLPKAAYADSADYALHDARYARSWAKGEFKLTVPRGNSAVKAAKSAFTKLEPKVQDFVTAVYSHSGNSELLDAQLDQLNGRTHSPVLAGDGPHHTDRGYDFEEHDQVRPAAPENKLTGRPVIAGDGPHGTDSAYDIEEDEDLAGGLADLSGQELQPKQ